jgi:cytochrome c-type biogenesis protein CcmH/NrfF
LLKFSVAIDWKDNPDNENEIDAHRSGGKLRISWDKRSIYASTRHVREPYPTRNLAQEEQLKHLSKKMTCPRCSKPFKPQDVTERLKYAIRCPHCRQLIVKEDLDIGLIRQLFSPDKIQFP